MLRMLLAPARLLARALIALVMFVVRYRVAVGALAAVTAVAVAIYVQGHNVERQNRIVRQITESRDSGRLTNCVSVNALAAAVNALNTSIQQIVLTSTRQSRAQGSVYRKLGLPPYKERLEQSREYRRQLEDAKIIALDCRRYVREPYSVRPKHARPPKLLKNARPKTP